MTTKSRIVIAAAAIAAVLAACATPERGPAVPADLTVRADTVEGMKNVRYYIPDGVHDMAVDGVESVRQEQKVLAARGHKGPLPPAYFLAVSGGGEDGAFGAGLLVGWTENGTRPEFKLVTGVSTGALTAPFAFLGPRYDASLRQVYTTITAKDVMTTRWAPMAALFDDALADTAPLRRLVERFADEQMLRDIAIEYEKGRLLLIGTTNLDARRGVIWNMGKIASSGNPRALELFRRILIASAAVPGAFPPVMFNVSVGDKQFQEMHVDGGAVAQVFVYPPGLDLKKQEQQAHLSRKRVAYVIRNARLDADWASVDRRTLNIIGRSISSLIQSQGVGDLYRIHDTARRDGVDFNLAHIPLDFDVPLKEPFDTVYMNALFKRGYEMGRAGYPWKKSPPGFVPSTPAKN